MMWRVLAMAAALGALGGCASVSGYPDSVKTSDYQLPSTVNDTAYYAASDPTVQAGLRNQIVFARLRLINQRYDQFIRDLNVQHNTLDLASDVAVLALGASGTLVKSASTKTALAAASTITGGTGTAIDKDLFYTQTIPAVVAQMDADRASTLVAIYTGLKESVSDYPLSAAEDGLDDYQRAGSIPNAISKLTTAAENTSTANKAQAAAALVGTYSFDSPGQLLQNFGWPSGVKNETNQASLRAKMTAEGVDTGVSVTSFVFMQQYAAQRAKVVSDLGLH